MKTTLTIAVLMMSFASASVFAEGSEITDSEIIVNTVNDDSIGVAIDNSETNIGSVSLANTKIDGSTIIVDTTNEGAIGVAIDNSRTNIGSVSTR